MGPLLDEQHAEEIEGDNSDSKERFLTLLHMVPLGQGEFNGETQKIWGSHRGVDLIEHAQRCRRREIGKEFIPSS